MTYRQKLLLKRLLIALGILILVAFLVLLIGFTYLGRYVVYTEDGAHFSFGDDEASSSTLQAEAPVAAPENPVLVTGDSILENTTLTDEETIVLEDYEVNGLIVDYETLADGSTLNAIELNDTGYNTLVLEMRSGSKEILNTEPVLSLIQRAKSQQLKLIAMISCLNDIAYAEEHSNEALLVYGGNYWLTSGGSYWLDPTQESVQAYISYMINTLSEMGFQEVILNHFSFPEDSSINYSSEEGAREQALIDSFQAIQANISSSCTLGLLITDPSTGHQAFDYAEHLYVYMSSGNAVSEYIEAHPDRYIVFVTDSHDTRFDEFGKLQADREDSFLPD